MEEEEVEPPYSGKLRHWRFQIQTLSPELRQYPAAGIYRALQTSHSRWITRAESALINHNQHRRITPYKPINENIFGY